MKIRVVNERSLVYEIETPDGGVARFTVEPVSVGRFDIFLNGEPVAVLVFDEVALSRQRMGMESVVSCLTGHRSRIGKGLHVSPA